MLSRLLLLCALALTAGCAMKASSPPGRTGDRCAGATLDLDDVLARCRVEGLTEPERVVAAAALQMHVRLAPPPAAGGPIGVELRLVNVTGATVEIDLVRTEIEPDPLPVLIRTDGFRVPNDMDASCTENQPAATGGGLGSRPRGERGVARVRLAPGGTLTASRTVASRNGLCVCAPDAAGVLDRRCTSGAGAPVPPGEYAVSVSMPAAVTRDDGVGRYGYPSLNTPLTLAAGSGEPWPGE
jgi:hypothetical protein